MVQRMNDQPIKLLDAICSSAQKICENAKTAKRNNKSLKSDNFYGNRFHELIVKLAGLETDLVDSLATTNLSASCIEEFNVHLAKIKSPEITVAQRNDALKNLQILSHSVLKPAFAIPPAHPTPKGDHVLPLAVVKGTRGYIENVVTQANACYEARCFDACSVMIRKLVEILLIDLYEVKGKQAAIKNGAGDYFMLSDLINIAIQDATWNFGRETKQALPKIKSLGDRAAHNRRYLATKTDVDGVISGLRVAVDDLLHLAGLK